MRRDVVAEEIHRLSRCAVLRLALGDQEWHTGSELAERVGHRFGASILRVSRGTDGGPAWLIHRMRATSSGSIWRYRFARALRPDEVAEGTTLKTENARLKRELVESRAQTAELGKQLREALGARHGS